MQTSGGLHFERRREKNDTHARTHVRPRASTHKGRHGYLYSSSTCPGLLLTRRDRLSMWVMAKSNPHSDSTSVRFFSMTKSAPLRRKTGCSCKKKKKSLVRTTQTRACRAFTGRASLRDLAGSSTFRWQKRRPRDEDYPHTCKPPTMVPTTTDQHEEESPENYASLNRATSLTRASNQ